MPNRSIRDEMQTPTPRTPRVFGTPIGATGGRPINTGRLKAGPASPAVQRAALQSQIGGAAIPRPPAAPPGSQGSASLASLGPLQATPGRMSTQNIIPRAGQPSPQASAGAPGPTTLVPGNPTADLTAATAGNRIAERPGLVNNAVDQMAR